MNSLFKNGEKSKKAKKEVSLLVDLFNQNTETEDDGRRNRRVRHQGNQAKGFVLGQVTGVVMAILYSLMSYNKLFEFIFNPL